MSRQSLSEEVRRMPITDPELQRLLRTIVRQLAPEPAWHDDLMQEALLHWWRLHQERPNQLPAWYVQGCRFHLRNYLRRGRSVDSERRAWRQTQWASGVDDDGDMELPDTGESVWREISANDLISTLSLWLTRDEEAVLHCLADGLSARETALRLNCSHTMVNRWRHRIADVAVQLGVEMPPTAMPKPLAGALPAPASASTPPSENYESRAP